MHIVTQMIAGRPIKAREDKLAKIQDYVLALTSGRNCRIYRQAQPGLGDLITVKIDNMFSSFELSTEDTHSIHELLREAGLNIPELDRS